MWQTMTTTSLIRAGRSGSSLRKPSSGGEGGGEGATGSEKGRFCPVTRSEESVPGAVGLAKAVWLRRTAESVSTASTSRSLAVPTPSGSAACEQHLLPYSYMFISVQTWCLIWLLTSSVSSYRKCERIEKGRIERILKPVKSMSVIKSQFCSFVHGLKRKKQQNNVHLTFYSQSRQGVLWIPCPAAMTGTGALEGTLRTRPRRCLESGNSPFVTSHHGPTAVYWSPNLRKRRRKKSRSCNRLNRQSSQM